MDKNAVIATGGYDHTIRLWSPTKGACKRTLQHGESQINALDISPDGTYIAAAGLDNVRVFDTQSNIPSASYSYEGHVGNVTAVGFSRDGSWMYTGGDDESVKIFDIRTTHGPQRNFDQQSPVTCVALHPNQAELISGDKDGRMVRWDLRANQCIEHLIPAVDVAIRSVSISPDANLVAAVNDDGNCYVWQLTGHDLCALKMLQSHTPAYVLQCKFSPDSKLLATTSSDTTAKVWDATKDFELTHELREHGAWVWDCAFTVDSSMLMTGCSDNVARLWDLSTSACMQEFKGHQRAITAVALRE
eukprot:m.95962 g.95962  ORF g.95962 m.95962 type:complete len:303 (+) comp16628_c0_seq1:160-1068(+)